MRGRLSVASHLRMHAMHGAILGVLWLGCMCPASPGTCCLHQCLVSQSRAFCTSAEGCGLAWLYDSGKRKGETDMIRMMQACCLAPMHVHHVWHFPAVHAGCAAPAEHPSNMQAKAL